MKNGFRLFSRLHPQYLGATLLYSDFDKRIEPHGGDVENG